MTKYISDSEKANVNDSIPIFM